MVSTFPRIHCLYWSPVEVLGTGTSMYAPHRWYNTRHSRRQPCTIYGVNRHLMETSCRTSSYRIVMKLQYRYGLDTKLLLCSRVQYPISWIVGVSVFLQYRSLNRRGANIPALAALGQQRLLPYFPSDCQTSMPAFVPL